MPLTLGGRSPARAALLEESVGAGTLCPHGPPMAGTETAT